MCGFRMQSVPKPFNLGAGFTQNLWLYMKSSGQAMSPAFFLIVPSLSKAWCSIPSSSPYKERARTATGLKMTVELPAGVHATGKKCSTDFIDAMRIVFDDFLPRWNYRAIPAMA